jgi:hypothetical protein
MCIEAIEFQLIVLFYQTSGKGFFSFTKPRCVDCCILFRSIQHDEVRFFSVLLAAAIHPLSPENVS